ncbi:hypothetical protein L9F63_019036, partial [Diploptera punctata]
PSAPVNVKAIALSSQKVNVSWQHPSETRGKLRYFKLNITLKSTGLKRQANYKKPGTQVVPHDKKTYFFE